MSSKFDAILQTANLIPPIPKAVQNILLLLNQNNLDIQELASAVRLDPVISGQVLKLANSAYFGRSKNVAGIEDAAVIIGIDSIRSMVLACGLMTSGNALTNFKLDRFWRLSLLSAFIAKDIAGLYGHNTDQAYTAALIHRLGVLAIQRAVPEVASEIDKVCEDRFPYDRVDIEIGLLGFDHAEVSAEIAKQWNLPERISESIRQYPHPVISQAGGLSALIHLCVAIAINITDDVPSTEWEKTLDVDVKDLLITLMSNLNQLQAKIDDSQRFVDMLVNGHQ
ncbi:MAG: HDOD domain-containing protein [Burkholderiales bacterium]|uniref:HDOD domain-containing protein n=1 Tax=Limnobacter sp. TaxID=2003368 RepID=UPI0039BCE06D|nr:HDOD domain-containing protein [Burkholderiales bacterium]